MIIKQKESEKREMYLGLARELKNLWNMKMMVIGVFGTVTKGLLKRLEDLEIREQMGTILLAALSRSAKI